MTPISRIFVLSLVLLTVATPVLAQTTYAPMIMGYTPCTCNGSSAAGVNGSWWYAGTNAPPLGLGKDGDFFLNTETADIYNRTGGIWGLLMNIMGPEGPPGAGGGSAADAVKTADEHIEQNRTSEHNAGILAHGYNDTISKAAAVNQAAIMDAGNLSQSVLASTRNASFAIDAAAINETKDLRLTGTRVMTGSLDVGGYTGFNVGPAKNATDAVNRSYVDNAVAGAGSGITLGAVGLLENPLIASNKTDVISASSKNLTQAMPLAGNVSVPASSIQDGIVLFADVLGHTFKDAAMTIQNVIASVVNQGIQAHVRNDSVTLDAADRNASFAVDASHLNDTARQAYVNSNASRWLFPSGERFGFANATTLGGGTALTFTFNTSTHLVIIELVGGGGGGGGVTGAGSSFAAGAGGGAGGYCRKTVQVTPSSTMTFTVGVNGTAGLQSGTAGGNGAATTATIGATTYTANGGTGGAGMTAATTAWTTNVGGNGATISTNCDINGAGEPGDFAVRVSGTQGWSGQGAPSIFGGGGNRRSHTGGAGVGADAIGPGGGGSGGLSTAATGYKGGTGGMGIIQVWEYA